MSKRLIVIVLALTAALTLTVNAASGFIIYPSEDVWTFSNVSGSGRGRNQSGGHVTFRLADCTPSARQVTLSAPSTLTSSPVDSMSYRQFSASWATSQSSYKYDEVSLQMFFSSGPEYSAASVFRFVMHIDSFAFGTVTDWTLDSYITGTTVEGFPLSASMVPLGRDYYLISVTSATVGTLSMTFLHSDTEFHSGFNVGSFSLSFSDAWADKFPDPAETEPVIAPVTYAPPSDSLPPLETVDLSLLEEQLRFDFPPLNLGNYMSAFAWWQPVFDGLYSSVPIFSIALAFGVILGFLRILGGLRHAPKTTTSTEDGMPEIDVFYTTAREVDPPGLYSGHLRSGDHKLLR